MKLLKFIASAWLHRHAYIDLDGCLLRKMKMPRMPGGPDAALAYWGANVAPTPIVRKRLVLCYVLKLLGVRLYIWTNRWPQHDAVTRQALGRHMWLFSGTYYMEGKKATIARLGPCMEDQKKFLGTKYADLLVEPL